MNNDKQHDDDVRGGTVVGEMTDVGKIPARVTPPSLCLTPTLRRQCGGGGAFDWVLFSRILPGREKGADSGFPLFQQTDVGKIPAKVKH